MNDCISNNSYLRHFFENEIKCILTTSHKERDSIVKLSHASRIIHNFEREIHLIQVHNCKNVLCLVYYYEAVPNIDDDSEVRTIGI